MDVLDSIRKNKARDNEVIKVVKEMKWAGVKVLENKEWRESDGLMLKERKIYVPKDEKLRAEVIRLYHDMPIEEHRGQWKTMELVYHKWSLTRFVIDELMVLKAGQNKQQKMLLSLRSNPQTRKPYIHK